MIYFFNDLYDESVIFSRTSNLFHRGRDRMVVGFTTTYVVSAYHH